MLSCTAGVGSAIAALHAPAVLFELVERASHDCCAMHLVAELSKAALAVAGSNESCAELLTDCRLFNEFTVTPRAAELAEGSGRKLSAESTSCDMSTASLFVVGMAAVCSTAHMHSLQLVPVQPSH